MPSQYLTLSEAPVYGLKSVTDAQISQASTLIDAYLKRPEGLVWAPDSTGTPCYMTTPVAQASFTLAQAIAPGATVPVTLTGPTGILAVGDVLILDRKNTALTEACVVATTVGATNQLSITFQNVLNAHAQGATVELGLVIEEQKYMPSNRPLTFLSRTPLMNVTSGVGRYGYGRRGDSANYNMEQFNLLAAVNKFGGPPVWELFQSSLSSSWDVQTGQVWVPAGIMLAYYSEVKLRYVAGFPAGSIPASVKFACARLIQAMQATPSTGNTKSLKAGDTSQAMFTASVLDEDTKASLQPYAARLFV